MKCLCVAGFGSVSQQFYSILTKAGMEAPAPALSQPSFDIYTWHRQVAALLEELADHQERPQAPSLGRMWENLASEIFLANSGVDLWGWADDLSVPLLDFWESFDPRVNFVLLFISAEDLIAASLEQLQSGEIEIEPLLDAWYRDSLRLLEFGRAHPQRCVMFDARAALMSPSRALGQIASKWNLPLVTEDVANANLSQESSIATLIARHLVQGASAVLKLQREINVQTAGNKPSGSNRTISPQELIESFKRLGDRSDEHARIHLLEEQCQRLELLYQRTLASYQEQYRDFQERTKSAADEMQRLKSQLVTLQESHQTKVAELEKELQLLSKSDQRKDRALQALEERLSSSVEENELLLLHMHQAQEELELVLAQRQVSQRASQERIQQLEAQLAETLKQRDASATAVNATQQQLRQQEEERIKVARMKAALEQKLEESIEENELLLLQLHQAQEELEASFLQGQKRERESIEQRNKLKHELDSAQQRVSALSAELAKLKPEFERVAKENKQHQNDLAQAKRDLTSLLKQRDEMGAELALSQSRLQQVLKERDQLAKRIEAVGSTLEKVQASAQALSKKVEDGESQITQLLKLKQEKERLIAAIQEKNASLEQEVQRKAAELDQLSRLSQRNLDALQCAEKALQAKSEENELVLLQLHQVQEELEHYFSHLQYTENKLAAVETRLRRMQQRYPDYVEYGAVEVCSVEGNQADWCIRELTLVGKEFSELRFSTVVEHGMAGLVFYSDRPESRDFFDAWPLVVKDQASITLLPLGTPKQVQERSAALLSLGTSEWSRFLALTDFLVSLLQNQPGALRAPEGFKPDLWLSALRTLKADLSLFPSVPRFDRLSLKREQVNPDYEHLWLSFDNLNLGTQSATRFEFRISCANVRPGSFGKFPKLEFPEGDGQSLFNSWFPESSDDFGDKLELRFALPEAMDLGVWHKLSSQDQDVLRKLIKFLPDCLRYLEQKTVHISRSWQQWQGMVAEVQRIAGRHVGLSRKENSSSAQQPMRYSADQQNEEQISAPAIDEFLGLLNLPVEPSISVKARSPNNESARGVSKKRASAAPAVANDQKKMR